VAVPRNGSFFGGPEPEEDIDTGVDQSHLVELLIKLTQSPQDFHVHPKLKRSQDERRKMAAGEEMLDWAAAEALAIASLAVEGHPVRFAGQDAQRGTFSHRHAVLHDVIDGRTHNIFSQLEP
jgi:2-oxoglutarate dehydrogenase E1 component